MRYLEVKFGPRGTVVIQDFNRLRAGLIPSGPGDGGVGSWEHWKHWMCRSGNRLVPVTGALSV